MSKIKRRHLFADLTILHLLFAPTLGGTLFPYMNDRLFNFCSCEIYSVEACYVYSSRDRKYNFKYQFRAGPYLLKLMLIYSEDIVEAGDLGMYPEEGHLCLRRMQLASNGSSTLQDCPEARFDRTAVQVGKTAIF